MTENKNIDGLKDEILKIFSNSLSIGSQPEVQATQLEPLVTEVDLSADKASMFGTNPKDVNININLEQINNAVSGPIKVSSSNGNYNINIKKNDDLSITDNILGGKDSSISLMQQQLSSFNHGLININNAFSWNENNKIHSNDNSSYSNLNNEVNNTDTSNTIGQSQKNINNHSNSIFIKNYTNSDLRYGDDLSFETINDLISSKEDKNTQIYDMSFIVNSPYDFLTNSSLLMINEDSRYHQNKNINTEYIKNYTNALKNKFYDFKKSNLKHNSISNEKDFYNFIEADYTDSINGNSNIRISKYENDNVSENTNISFITNESISNQNKELVEQNENYTSSRENNLENINTITNIDNQNNYSTSFDLYSNLIGDVLRADNFRFISSNNYDIVSNNSLSNEILNNQSVSNVDTNAFENQVDTKNYTNNFENLNTNPITTNTDSVSDVLDGINSTTNIQKNTSDINTITNNISQNISNKNNHNQTYSDNNHLSENTSKKYYSDYSLKSYPKISDLKLNYVNNTTNKPSNDDISLDTIFSSRQLQNIFNASNIFENIVNTPPTNQNIFQQSTNDLENINSSNSLFRFTKINVDDYIANNNNEISNIDKNKIQNSSKSQDNYNTNTVSNIFKDNLSISDNVLFNSINDNIVDLDNNSNVINKSPDVSNNINNSLEASNVINKLPDVSNVLGDVSSISNVINNSLESSNILNKSPDVSNVLNNSLESSNVLNNSLESSNVINKSSDVSNVLNNSLQSSNVLNKSSDVSNVLGDVSSVSNVLNNSLESSNVLNKSPDVSNVINNSLESSNVLNNSLESSNVINNSLESSNVLGDISSVSNVINKSSDVSNLLNNSLESTNLSNIFENSSNLTNRIIETSSLSNVINNSLESTNVINKNLDNVSNVSKDSSSEVNNETFSASTSFNETLTNQSNIISNNGYIRNNQINTTNIAKNNIVENKFHYDSNSSNIVSEDNIQNSSSLTNITDTVEKYSINNYKIKNSSATAENINSEVFDTTNISQTNLNISKSESSDYISDITGTSFSDSSILNSENRNNTNSSTNIKNQSNYESINSNVSNTNTDIIKNDTYRNMSIEDNNVLIEPLTEINKEVLTNNKNYSFFGQESYLKIDINDIGKPISKRDVYTNLVNRIGAQRVIQSKEKILLLPAFQNTGIVKSPSLVVAGEKESETILKTQQVKEMLGMINNENPSSITDRTIEKEIKTTLSENKIKKMNDNGFIGASKAIQKNEEERTLSDMGIEQHKEEKEQEDKPINENKSKGDLKSYNIEPSIIVPNVKGKEFLEKKYIGNSSISMFQRDITKEPIWRREYM